MLTTLVAILTCCTLTPVWCEPSDAEIAKAVENLGNNSYAERERATLFLWSCGRAAEPALQKALGSSDLEIAARAGIVLEKIKFGILPGTPGEIEGFVFQFHYGDYGAKYRVIGELLAKGPTGHTALVTLVKNIRDERLREQIGSQMAVQLSQRAAALLGEGKVSEAERLLEVCLASRNVACVRHFAAYHLIQGRIGEEIRRWQAKVDGSEGVVLACLHRAAGDLAKARAAAEASGNTALLKSVLFELGDWKALANLYSGQPASPDAPVHLPTEVGLHWLAGDAEKCQQATAKLMESIAQPNYGHLFWDCAEALLLTGQPDRAISLLTERQQYERAFELLCAQLRYKEAFDLYQKAVDAKYGNLLNLKITVAGTLAALGERAKALEMFRNVAEEQKQAGNFSWTAALLDKELQAGFKDEAFEHCAGALARLQPGNNTAWLLAKLFPDRAAQADALWVALRRRSPGGDATGTLKTIQQLLQGKLADPELLSLAKELEQEAEDLGQKEKAALLQALGEVFRSHRKTDQAIVYASKAAELGETDAGYAVLGDLLFREKRWKEAADSYAKASEKNRATAIPVFFRGYALEQGGDPAEGKKLMDLADLMLLANDTARYMLAEAQRKMGLLGHAARQRELILKTGDVQSWHTGDALRKAIPALLRGAARREVALRTGNVQPSRTGDALREAIPALVAGEDFAKAALYWERAMIDCLRPGIAFQEWSAYLEVPEHVYTNRARQFLKEGKTEDALKTARLSQTTMPGGVDLAVSVVPDLEEAGHTKEADEILKKPLEALTAVLATYPDSPLHCNQLAWLLGRCGRDLDMALRLIEKALQHSPDNAAYLDTLAEVYFQRGDREKAIETSKRCIELDPSNDYYSQQLKRFQTEEPLSKRRPDGR
jgi:tetratricopeptide (TPR) repeat protein